jgi:ABC-type amino acid transport system permease subunit
MPSPRQSLNLGDAAFLNIRGLYLPAPQFEAGFGWVLATLGIAVVLGHLAGALGAAATNGDRAAVSGGFGGVGAANWLCRW